MGESTSDVFSVREAMLLTNLAHIPEHALFACSFAGQRMGKCRKRLGECKPFNMSAKRIEVTQHTPTLRLLLETFPRN